MNDETFATRLLAGIDATALSGAVRRGDVVYDALPLEALATFSDAEIDIAAGVTASIVNRARGSQWVSWRQVPR